MNSTLRLGLLTILAASHGVNDFLAGWLLGGAMPEATAWDRLPWLVIYAALAFAGQLPAAWWMERSAREDRWLVAALGLMVLAVAARFISPGLAVIISGIASALCHVAGGALALRLPKGEQAIGWFSAPGIVGLTLGGWCGYHLGELAAWAMILPGALLAGWFLLRPSWREGTSATPPAMPAPGIDAHDGLMLLLLLALTLRSALWDLVHMAQLHDPQVLLALALSAGAGKVAGGSFVSRWPSVRHVSLGLLVACAVLDLARGHLIGLCLGVALLQSTIPASIFILHRAFGTSGARASAYGLGLTVALGGLILPFHLPLSVILMGAGLAALLLIWRALGRERRWLAG